MGHQAVVDVHLGPASTCNYGDGEQGCILPLLAFFSENFLLTRILFCVPVVIRIMVFTHLHFGRLVLWPGGGGRCQFTSSPIPESSCPVVSAVVQVIALALRRLGARLPADWKINVSLAITWFKVVFSFFGNARN